MFSTCFAVPSIITYPNEYTYFPKFANNIIKNTNIVF